MKTPGLNSIYADLVFYGRIKTIIIFVLLALLFISVSNNKKPPLVIRTTPHTMTVNENYQTNNGITNYDIDLFVRHFIQRLNFYDSFALEQAIPQALNMMTTSLRNYYKHDVCQPEFLRKLIDSQTKTKTDIKEIDFNNNNGQITVTAIYKREIIKYDSNKKAEKMFRAEMVIKKLDARTKKYPYGMQVSHFKEIDLND